MNELTEYIKSELYPKLYEDIDTAFPDWGFKRKSGRWVSKKRLDGNDSTNPEKIYIGAKYASGTKIYENGGDPNGISLLDFEILNGGGNVNDPSDIYEAVIRLADRLKISRPPENEADKEKFAKAKVRQDKREEANNAFRNALYNPKDPQAVEVLSYLRDRRKWTDEEILQVGLGYMNAENRSLLPWEDYHRKAEDGTEKELSSMGYSHTLTIPYRSGSRLVGFKVRNIHATSEDKYKYLNTYGLDKGANLLGSTGRYNQGDRVIVVEGELDALHAIARAALEGRKDIKVVSTAGGGLTDSLVADAVKAGINSVLLLMDSDNSGQRFIAPSMAAVEKVGINAFVSSLPTSDGHGNPIKDTDDYLKYFSLTDWELTIEENAKPSYAWRYTEILKRYRDMCIEGELTPADRERYFSEVEALYRYIKPYNREDLLSFIAASDSEADLNYNLSDLREYLTSATERSQAAADRKALENALQEAQKLLAEGRTEEARKTLQGTAKEPTAADKLERYERIARPRTPQQLEAILSKVKEGIPTGYKFGDQLTQDGEELLTLKSGVTLLCGYSGHGKTSMLNCIALNEARRLVEANSSKKVLYISLEVSETDLLPDLINNFVGDPNLQNTKAPKKALISYYKGAGSRYFTTSSNATQRGENGYIPVLDREGRPVSHFDNFTAKERIFRERFYDRTLKVIYEEDIYNSVEGIVDFLSWYLERNEVSLICLDYAQLLQSDDYSRQRTEEIKRVVNYLKRFANSTQTPFVMATQFNRAVSTPASVEMKCIGEGGDFERIADTIVGLFNLERLSNNVDKDEKREACLILQRLTGKPFLGKDEEGKTITADLSADIHPELKNKVYAKLLKRRGGKASLDTLLDWEGKLKTLYPNAPEELTTEAVQSELNLDDPGEENICPF